MVEKFLKDHSFKVQIVTAIMIVSMVYSFGAKVEAVQGNISDNTEDIEIMQPRVRTLEDSVLLMANDIAAVKEFLIPETNK